MNVETPILLTIHGLKPEKLTGTTFRISRGWCADQTGNEILKFPGDTILDLNTIGLNGRDRAGVNNQDVHIYVIYNPTTGQQGFIASPSIAYGPAQEPGDDEVLVPEGFVAFRKLMFGVKYRTAWGGIPFYHIAHWPMPRIRLTEAEDTVTYRACTDLDTNDSWLDVDLSPFMPDNARMALLSISCKAVGTAGSVYIRSVGSQSTGIKVASVSPAASVPDFSTMWEIRPDSSHKIQAKTIGGAKITVAVLGYDMTEYS